MARVWFERNADKAHSLLKKEEAAARNKELRKQLEYLEDTEWFYTPIDELIGQYWFLLAYQMPYIFKFVCARILKVFTIKMGVNYNIFIIKILSIYQ